MSCPSQKCALLFLGEGKQSLLYQRVQGKATFAIHLPFSSLPCRPADCVEVHHEGHGASSADRPSALLCHPDVCYHWLGVLQWEVAPSVFHEQFR